MTGGRGEAGKPEEPADPGDLEDTVPGVARPAVEAVGSADEDTVIQGSIVIGSIVIDTEESPYPLIDPADTDPTERGPATRAGRASAIRSGGPAIAEREPAQARAHLHAFRIGAHEPILLDVPALIGRRPALPRVTGTRHPRLVRVPSPASEISATHLEVRQEGSSVVVTDLGSTNGTLVEAPSVAPRKLRQGESLVVVAGSVVDIGDGIRIEILPASEAAQ